MSTETEHLTAVSRVLDYVQMHLDEEFTPRDLADVACFSPHYFHRVFRSVVGESVMDHVRRLRLERAAYRLNREDVTVSDVAMQAGYPAQEVFTRIFQAHFGVPPRTFRRSGLSHLLPAPSPVHYEGPGFTVRELVQMVEPDLMDDACLCDFHRANPPSLHEILVWAGHTAELIFPTHPAPFISNEDPFMSNVIQKDREIEQIEEEIKSAKRRLAEARRDRPREDIADCELKDVNGNPVMFSELFGDKEDLLVVHNMGTGCIYCTMWADGFTGLAPHLSDRAAFVMFSPDPPEVQKRFSQKRNWNFRMISTHGTDFAKELGFENDRGPQPGVSSFKRDPDGRLHRIAKTYFEPGDDFCATWSFLDLIPEGVNGWEPRYDYK